MARLKKVWNMDNVLPMSPDHLPILYTFRRCPYAMRARFALAEAGMALEQREVSLKNKPQAMLQASAKGTVPILQLPHGKVIDESLDIMLWALQQANDHPWLQHQARALALIHDNDHAFKPWLDKYKYADRFPEQSVDYYCQQGEVFLQVLEDLLQKHPFLHGQQPTLADKAIFPFVRQFAFVDKPWFDAAPYAKLQIWLQYHLQSSLFAQIMVKHQVWQPSEVRK